METVDHHGRTTAYRVHEGEGTAQPALFVHGSGTDRSVWAGQRPLAAERPVVAVDLSGHGDSEDVDADPGYETLTAYAQDVVAVADATGAGVLVGASLGGAVALRVALEGSLAPAALALVGAGAKLSVLEDLLTWLEGDFRRAVDFLHRPDVLFYDADEATLERSRRRFRETGRAVTRRDFLTCHRFDVRDRLGAVDVPALALVGEYDRLTPRWYSEYLARNMPDCELAVIEAAAHLPMVERPGAFNDVLSEFLAARGR